MTASRGNTNWLSILFLLACQFPVPIEGKSFQNISINNFQLHEPYSIIEINKNHFCKWQNHKWCTYSRIRCNQSQSLHWFHINSEQDENQKINKKPLLAPWTYSNALLISTYKPEIPISKRIREILKLNWSLRLCPSKVQIFEGINSRFETWTLNKLQNSFLVRDQNECEILG